MPLFEVFIPGREAGNPNVTLTVDAPNWIGALRSGLKSIGEGQEAIANVMCDIKEDNSIHVTDVSTHRVFRLREVPSESAPPRPVATGTPAAEVPLEQAISAQLTGEEETVKLPATRLSPDLAPQPRTLLEFPIVPPVAPPAVNRPPPPPTGPVSQPTPAQPPPAAAAPKPAARPEPAPAPAPRPAPSSTAQVTKPVTMPQPAHATSAQSIPPTARGAPAPKPKRPSGQFTAAPEPKSRAEHASKPNDPKIGRTVAQPVDAADAIAAVFDATQDLYMASKLTGQKIADTLLDIALAHIPAESGTFYIADVNGHELAFTAVRGPKADELKRSGISVRVGQGIVGFCAQEGICLLVSDIKHDPRFDDAIAKSINHVPRDTLCASAEKDGRLWGAVQLINSKSGFDATHMEVLRFIGLTAAALFERVNETA